MGEAVTPAWLGLILFVGASLWLWPGPGIRRWGEAMEGERDAVNGYW
jgi:hypothetical protein